MDILILKSSLDIRAYSAYRSLQLFNMLRKNNEKLRIVDLNQISDCRVYDYSKKIVIVFDWMDQLNNVSLQNFLNILSKDHELYYTGRVGFLFSQYINSNFKKLIRMDLEDFSNQGIPLDLFDIYTNKKIYPYIPLLSSNGCSGKCTFCANNIISTKLGVNKKWNPLKVNDILKYIEEIIKIRKDKCFVFIDNDFLGDWDIQKLLIDELLPLKIKYFAEARIDSLLNSDLALLKKSGLKKLSIGIESGCDTILKRMNKNQNVAECERALELLAKNNILIDPFFIMFIPDMTFDELGENIDFIGRNKLYNFFHTSSLLSKQYVFDWSNPKGQKYMFKDEKVAKFYKKIHENKIFDISSIDMYKEIEFLYRSF